MACGRKCRLPTKPSRRFCGARGEARAHFLARKAPAFLRRSASVALREEIARLLADPSQPVRALIDDAAVRDNAYSANPDTEELAFLLRVNEWMARTEAEAEL